MGLTQLLVIYNGPMQIEIFGRMIYKSVECSYYG